MVTTANGMAQHWLLYADDSASSRPFLFHRVDKSGRATLASEYSHLVCRRCRKFDELKALALGVFGDNGVTDNLDYLKAYEGIAIVSWRMREIIQEIPESNVGFFEMPKSPAFFVAVPSKIFFPAADDPAYEATNFCPQCGRFRNVVWGTERPKIKEPCEIGVFRLENRISMTSVWVISDSTLRTLRAATPPLKGFQVDEEDIVFSSY
jgi:hypothetical protein